LDFFFFVNSVGYFPAFDPTIFFGIKPICRTFSELLLRSERGCRILFRAVFFCTFDVGRQFGRPGKFSCDLFFCFYRLGVEYDRGWLCGLIHRKFPPPVGLCWSFLR